MKILNITNLPEMMETHGESTQCPMSDVRRVTVNLISACKLSGRTEYVWISPNMNMKAAIYIILQSRGGAYDMVLPLHTLMEIINNQNA
jgi:hypothetical protein